MACLTNLDLLAIEIPPTSVNFLCFYLMFVVNDFSWMESFTEALVDLSKHTSPISVKFYVCQ
jgi:hypothetical protein